MFETMLMLTPPPFRSNVERIPVAGGDVVVFGIRLNLHCCVQNAIDMCTNFSSEPPLQHECSGFAEMSVAVNAAPTGGYTEATPRTGVAALDTFTLESLDWSDDVDDLPLLYSFSYVNGQVSHHAHNHASISNRCLDSGFCSKSTCNITQLVATT